MSNYYDEIASGYDELHREEQEKKLAIIKNKLSIDKNELLLDVGCGTGISMSFDCKQIGVDPSFELLKIAKKDGKAVAQAVAEYLPFKDNSFDIIVSVTALQNFDDIQRGLQEIKRVSRDKIILSVLKKTEKSEQIEKLIAENFTVEDTIEEEKDLIYFLRK